MNQFSNKNHLGIPINKGIHSLCSYLCLIINSMINAFIHKAFGGIANIQKKSISQHIFQKYFFISLMPGQITTRHFF